MGVFVHYTTRESRVKTTIFVCRWCQALSSKSKWPMRMCLMCFLNIPCFLSVIYIWLVSPQPSHIPWHLSNTCSDANHDDVIKWKYFPRYWPFVREFTGHRWNPRTKASDAELGCFLWSAPWINGWINNRKSGDLRRHRGHYDVNVMSEGINPNSAKWKLSPAVNLTNVDLVTPSSDHYSTRGHYNDVTMIAIAPQISGIATVCSSICSGLHQRKHQRSASLVLWGESSGDPWIPLTKR